VTVRTRLVLATLGAWSFVLGGLTAAPATATMTTLCTTYAGCAELGYSSSGYAKNNSTMYWRMYSGHNCTNYAAYRMVKSGLPNVRPWSGEGNASNWGAAMADITNQTPTVGAVAWWKAYASPAGSAGHVAYVEKVLSADEIVISQDSWGGTFSWAVLERGGKGWPSGFVHFNDVPMLNTAPPAITGTAKVGGTLNASPGTWNPSDVTASYIWRANGRRITGATDSSITLTEDQLDKTITVKVTASRLGYPTTSVLSAATEAVLPGAMKTVVAPTVSGTAKVDSSLVAATGSYYPAPDSVTLEWLADGEPVVGATQPTLAIGPDLVGKALSVRTTATRAGYDDLVVTSRPTVPVAPGTFALQGTPTVTGTPQPGQTLTVTGLGVTPAAGLDVQWLRDGAPIAGATSATYAVTEADLGARIVARVTFTRPGYTTLVERVSAPARIRVHPRIYVGMSLPRPGHLTVDVDVTARGVTTVEGALRVRIDGKLLAQLPLHRGGAVLRLTLPHGWHRITVVLPQSRSVERATTTRRVKVL